ncbi:MAG: transporter substrate-binding domain-containing protein [Chloroflexota bacterium]
MLKSALRFCLIVFILTGTLLVAQAQTATPSPSGPTLNSILSRGQVNCGVNQDLPGFGYLDPNTGAVSGFDVDFCRALGAAIFGDATAANLLLYSGNDGIAALQKGDVDVLFHNIVWSPALDGNGLTFGPINFYNGQTMMVRSESGLGEWPNLNGKTICVTTGSNAETSLPEALTNHGINAQILKVDSFEAARDALSDGRCDAESAGRVELEVLRQQSGTPDAFIVWKGADRLYTHEPFAPMLRYGDQQWSSIVEWTSLGLIQAEQLDVSSENIATLVQNAGEQPDAYVTRVGQHIAHLLNTSLDAPNNLGLAPDFMAGVIREVGNYGEIYNRNLGTEIGELKLDRGVNALAADGGLLYAPDWQ